MSHKLSIRQPLLDEDVEETLKAELSKLWLAGKKGKDRFKRFRDRNQ